jgi:hypothetical protein
MSGYFVHQTTGRLYYFPGAVPRDARSFPLSEFQPIKQESQKEPPEYFSAIYLPKVTRSAVNRWVNNCTSRLLYQWRNKNTPRLTAEAAKEEALNIAMEAIRRDIRHLAGGKWQQENAPIYLSGKPNLWLFENHAALTAVFGDIEARKQPVALTQRLRLPDRSLTDNRIRLKNFTEEMNRRSLNVKRPLNAHRYRNVIERFARREAILGTEDKARDIFERIFHAKTGFVARFRLWKGTHLKTPARNWSETGWASARIRKSRKHKQRVQRVKAARPMEHESSNVR